jgi:arabinofuranosyltransferase
VHSAEIDPPGSRWRWLLLGAALAVAWFGAQQLAFLCDDAFIHFRYVANAHAGHGLVWNRDPFLPVDGYTGVGWPLLLWAVWSWSGVEPPASVNFVSMVLGCVQVVIVAAAATRLRDATGRRFPLLVGAVVVAIVFGNRTFLQWFTGGLDTPLFNVGFIGWVVWAFRHQRSGIGWLVVWSIWAVVATLARADGMVLVAATVAVAAFDVVRRRRSCAAAVGGVAPLAVVVAQMLWHNGYYGDWLPNTYYAKIGEPWPESGLRYLATWALEHGTWAVPLLVVIWITIELRRRVAFFARAITEHAAGTAAVAATVFHSGYYVLKVGGDHFEWRVFSQLVPLVTLAVAAMAARLGGRRCVVTTTAMFGLLSSAGWWHFAWTSPLPNHGFVAIAERLPGFLQPIGRFYDRHQAWLRFHNVCLRCEHHASILEDFRRPFAARPGLRDPVTEVPVLAAAAVGMAGWALPDVAILDLHGLNDWVVARTPPHRSGPMLDRSYFAPVFQAADVDRDGSLDAGELRSVLTQVAIANGADPSKAGQADDAADFMIEVMLAIHSFAVPGKLTLVEAMGIPDMLLRARSMAHERHPPPGYVEDLEPNVTIEGDVVRAAPRKVPLTPERVRAIEHTWRQRVRDGTSTSGR